MLSFIIETLHCACCCAANKVLVRFLHDTRPGTICHLVEREENSSIFCLEWVCTSTSIIVQASVCACVCVFYHPPTS